MAFEAGQSLWVALLGGAAMVAPPALAQSVERSGQAAEATANDIVVTATKRSESVQDVPLTIGVVTGETLEQVGATGINDVISRVPGLTASGNGSWRNSFAVRGIANVGGSFATVGYYIDETPISTGDAATSVNLFDLQSVEVIKGPQGTLFGEGSIGGVVRVITEKPNLGEVQAKALAGVGFTRRGGTNYQASAALNLPLVTDRLGIRLVGSYTDADGFLDNATTGAEDVNFNRVWNLRGSLKAQFSERFSITAGVMYQHTRGGADPNLNPTPLAITLNESARLPRGADLTLAAAFDEGFQDEFVNPTLNASWDGGRVSVVSATSYFSRRADTRLDDRSTTQLFRNTFDSPAPPFFGRLRGFPLPSGTPSETRLDDEVFSQEVRALSTGKSRFNWLVGGFYRWRRNDRDQVQTTPDILPLLRTSTVFVSTPSITYEQIAAFGEVSYRLSDRLEATFGLRIFREDVEASNRSGNLTNTLAGLPFFNPFQQDTRRDEGVLFKGALQYELTPDSTLYALFSQGVRPGGLNTRAVPEGSPVYPPGLPLIYGEDSTNNYEIGFKSQLLDRRLTLNLSAFWIDWDQVQVPFNPVPTVAGTVNGGRARSIGVEGELSYRFRDGLNIGVSATYNEAELRRDVLASTGGVVYARGATLPISPRFKSYLFAAFERPLNDALSIGGRIDHEHTSRRFAGVEGSAGVVGTLGAYDVLNAQASLTGGRWQLTAFADNLFDKRAELAGGGFNDVEGVVINRPRTLGLRLRTNF